MCDSSVWCTAKERSDCTLPTGAASPCLQPSETGWVSWWCVVMALAAPSFGPWRMEMDEAVRGASADNRNTCIAQVLEATLVDVTLRAQGWLASPSMGGPHPQRLC